MPILETATRNAACDAVVDAIDGGAGAGTLVLQTSGDVEIATLTFSDPAFGAASTGTATASAITEDSSATGGTAAQASAFTSTPTKVIEFSVATSGADIAITSTTVAATETVTCSSLTVTVPAS